MDFKKGITYKERTKLRNFKAALQSDIVTSLKNSPINEDDFESKNSLYNLHDRFVVFAPMWRFTGRQERSSGDGQKRILFPLLASDTLLNEYKTLYEERQNLRLARSNPENNERTRQITYKLDSLKLILINESNNEYNRLAHELMNTPTAFSSRDKLTDDNVIGWVANLHLGPSFKGLVNVKFRVSVVPAPRKERLYEYVTYEILGNNRSRDRTVNEKKILSFGLIDSFLLKVAFRKSLELSE